MAGVVGGAVFVLFLLALDVAWFWAVLIGVAAYGGTVLITRRSTPAVGDDTHPFGVSEETVKRVVEEGRSKVREIVGYGSRLPKAEVREKVRELAATAEKIFVNLQRDPKDLPHARQFLNYYLDAACNIVRGYAELSGQQSKSPEIRQTLDKAESVLGLIDQAFENQLARLLEDDVMDLDSEIELLQKTVEMENLFKGTAALRDKSAANHTTNRNSNRPGE